MSGKRSDPVAVKTRIVKMVGHSGVILENGAFLSKAYIQNWPSGEEEENQLLNTKDPITIMVTQWVAIQRGLL